MSKMTEAIPTYVGGLRHEANCWGTDTHESKVLHEVADRIEKLEAELKTAKSFHDVAVQQRDTEIKRADKAMELVYVVTGKLERDALEAALSRSCGEDNGHEDCIAHVLKAQVERYKDALISISLNSQNTMGGNSTDLGRIARAALGGGE